MHDSGWQIVSHRRHWVRARSTSTRAVHVTAGRKAYKSTMGSLLSYRDAQCVRCQYRRIVPVRKSVFQARQNRGHCAVQVLYMAYLPAWLCISILRESIVAVLSGAWKTQLLEEMLWGKNWKQDASPRLNQTHALITQFPAMYLVQVYSQYTRSLFPLVNHGGLCLVPLYHRPYCYFHLVHFSTLPAKDVERKFSHWVFLVILVCLILLLLFSISSKHMKHGAFLLRFLMDLYKL